MEEGYTPDSEAKSCTRNPISETKKNDSENTKNTTKEGRSETAKSCTRNPRVALELHQKSTTDLQILKPRTVKNSSRENKNNTKLEIKDPTTTPSLSPAHFPPGVI